ncbi:hypothetical protein GUJ93_ZPchr0002g25433 [Zizania palustris]|uniref:Pyruvate dehydrogenase E1 component subunit alpha n=1 Tax=Zizania palustris TaxID=103762 RepID=A0A8J5SAT2_ZIZPA|nr:hypothetical protein GUJ93_ZPchr0002g25433 [Zizania palustris]
MAAAALLRRVPVVRAPASTLIAARAISNSTAPLTIETSVPFTSHIVDPPSRDVTTTPAEILTFFHDMSVMRRMEIAADSLYKAKLIRGFCHLYDGQEAVAVGMEAAITRSDSIITAYRDHCIYLARGGDLVSTFAELMGRQAGCSRGKGGSMHFYKKDANFYGGHGIVGAQVPLGCGLAFAQKYRKEESATFALYGDGAANQGQLFEALNISALWKLPAILVCENNHYGMGTAEWRAAKSPAYYKRGDYVPGLKVDGMDVLAVKQACKFAKEHAIANGPIVLEMDTYRYHGHSMSDPGSTYRTRDEISGVRQERDPIERVRKLILAHDLATPAELKDMEKEIRKEVDDAIAKAKESPMPDTSELFTNVYVKGFGVESFGADRKELTAECRSGRSTDGRSAFARGLVVSPAESLTPPLRRLVQAYSRVPEWPFNRRPIGVRPWTRRLAGRVADAPVTPSRPSSVSCLSKNFSGGDAHPSSSGNIMARRTFQWPAMPADTPNQGWPWLDSALTPHLLGTTSACARASAWGCMVAPGRVDVDSVLAGVCGRASGHAGACGRASACSVLADSARPGSAPSACASAPVPSTSA